MAALLLLLVTLAPATASEPDAVAGGSAARFVALAMDDMQHARMTADPAWYRRAAAALDAAEHAPDADPYAILRTRAWVKLGEHDFHAARQLAEAAATAQPRDWWNDATIADACVELGDYDCAERAVDALLARRPGIQAWTRAAWLRTLFGDREGALELLHMAAGAAATADAETRAWTLTHLALEELAAGDLPAATHDAETAAATSPDHPLALAALARLRVAAGRLDDADALYARVTERVPTPDLVAALADVREARGDQAGAAFQMDFVDHLARVATAVGGSYGRQLAMVYADHDRRLPDALALARAETAIRDDVYTEDALAWALLKNDRPRAAARAIHRACRLGTDDAVFHYHAGLIAARLGRSHVAARLLRRAVAGGLQLGPTHAADARATLAALSDDSRRASR